jgi:predicted helicase
MSSFNVKGELNNYGFCIKKKKYDKSLIKQIKNYFTVKKEIGDRFIKIIKYPLYYEIDKFLVIPKFFSIKHIDIDEIQIDDIKYNKIQFITKKLNYQYDTVKFNFKGKMRDYQQECIDFVRNLFNNNEKTPKGGLLKFSCGMGKTLMAIYLSYILGVKTLIIVHLGDLLDQ